MNGRGLYLLTPSFGARRLAVNGENLMATG